MPRDNKTREQLYVTVPVLFRCPISMDVMKSPVSLYTGVTYDRTSIEKWLSLGHKTCPATMQTLPSTDTTPNLTLRRLIRLWIAHADGILEPSISEQQAADIVSGEFDAGSLAKVIAFVTASEENLKFVARSDESISRLVEAIAKRSGEIRICETIVEILDLISPVDGVREKLSRLILKCGDGDGGGDCLSSLSVVLRDGNAKSKAKTAKILEVISLKDSESQIKIAEKSAVLYELYSLTNLENDVSSVEAGFSVLLAVATNLENDVSSVEAGFSVLLAVATTGPVRKELVRFGVAKTVGKILSGDDCSASFRAVTEKALAVLAAVATCTEGRGAIAEDRECVVGIVKRLMKCSGEATEHGITVLWSVCCLARDGVAQERVGTVEGLTKVLLVMQSNCGTSTMQMCRELVKVLTAKCRKSNLSPYSYVTRTTHIAPY